MSTLKTAPRQTPDFANGDLSESAPKADYQSTIQSRAARHTGIIGIILDRSASDPFGPKGCIPVSWCLCVQDSPDNPCPCDGPIVWVPLKKILRQTTLSQKGGSGAPKMRLDLDPQTVVYMDVTQKVEGRGPKAGKVFERSADGAFTPAKGELWIHQLAPMKAGSLERGLKLIASDSRLTTMAKAGPGWIAAVIGAYEIIVTVGDWVEDNPEVVDAIVEGLSDLADWIIPW